VSACAPRSIPGSGGRALRGNPRVVSNAGPCLSEERLKEIAPVAWVDGSEPPFLVIHGTRDVQIPSVMSQRFVEVLEDSGVDAELLLVDAGHGFETQPINVPVNVESLTATEEFIAGLP